jgi:hypothetical protein
MDSLQLLLIKNQSLLGKLRARLFYCNRAIKEFESDTHRQLGPLAGYWDEWIAEAEDIKLDLQQLVIIQADFLLEASEYFTHVSQLTRINKNHRETMAQLEADLDERYSQLSVTLKYYEERIILHQDLTKSIMLVEATDGLSDD